MKHLLIIFAAITCFSCKQENTSIVFSTEQFKIEKINSNLYIHVSYIPTQKYGNVPCNGLIWIKEQEAIVFDSPVDSASANILIRHLNQNNIKVKAVVAHHFHEDCTGGLAAFHKGGIVSYGTLKTIELSKKYAKAIVPTRQLSNADYLTLQKDTVHIRYLGEAHTKDNIVSYIPNEKVLFGGCAVKELNGSKGYLGDANVNEWSNTIRKVKSNFPNAKTIIPGHGKYGGMELLDYTIQLFEQNIIMKK